MLISGTNLLLRCLKQPSETRPSINNTRAFKHKKTQAPVGKSPIKSEVANTAPKSNAGFYGLGQNSPSDGSEVAQQGVKDSKVLAAMEAVPRHLFIEPDYLVKPMLMPPYR